MDDEMSIEPEYETHRWYQLAKVVQSSSSFQFPPTFTTVKIADVSLTVINGREVSTEYQ